MLSSKNLSFFAFANSVCLIIFSLLNSRISLAETIVSRDAIIDISNTYSSSIDSELPKTLFQKINGIGFFTFSETLLVYTFLISSILFIWFFRKPRKQILSKPGFKIINIKEKCPFIPLKNEIQTLELLSEIETNKKFRLSSNLNRVILTPHKNSFLLEDKNFKNALLINRRRSHRKILFHDDVLDVGEMVLLYCNEIFSEGKFECERIFNNHQVFVGYKPRGPIQKGIPVLTVAGSQQEIALLRNSNTLGTSNINDIIIKSNEVALRHAKIYKVGQSWKIQNIQNYETTMVNGRRIEQRLLKEGDEVAIGDFIFKFKTSKIQINRSRKVNKESKIKTIVS